MPRFLSLARHAADAQPSEHHSLTQLTERWRIGELSNLDYLMHLNALAGRHPGDCAFAPLLPWVLDFSRPPEPDMDTVTVPPASDKPLSSSDDAECPTGVREMWRLCRVDLAAFMTWHHCWPAGVSARVAGPEEDQVAAGEGR